MNFIVYLVLANYSAFIVLFQSILVLFYCCCVLSEILIQLSKSHFRLVDLVNLWLFIVQDSLTVFFVPLFPSYMIIYRFYTYFSLTSNSQWWQACSSLYIYKGQFTVFPKFSILRQYIFNFVLTLTCVIIFSFMLWCRFIRLS